MSKIEIKHLNKRLIGSKENILNDINLTFDGEKIYGLFGQNGAGKSTLMSLISDYNKTTSGEILLNGQEIHNNQALINKVYYMNQMDMFPKHEKLEKLFRMISNIYPNYDLSLQKDLINKFNVDIKKTYNSLSTGYKSIVKIIISLCVPCEFILLDEPTLGLDARNREIFYRELIASYSKNPRTFIISTHIIEEVDQLINEVVFIKDGHVKINTSVDDICSQSYSVSGPAEDVDSYVQGIHILEKESLGRYETVYFMHELPDNPRPESVDVEKMKLQKLLVYLINSEEIK